MQAVIRLVLLHSEVEPIDQGMAEPAPAIASPSIHLELQAPRVYLFESEIGSPNPSHEESPRANRDLQMFDPRLQKKLQEAAERNSRSVTTLESSWMDATGNSHVKLGNGKCLRSMAPARPGEVTNWQLPSNCGKSEGDKMLENMERELNKSKR
ncbi:MAG TPA: hypothetical protein VN030_15765 [Cellvibrio sp.]|nr:hypothetical protein [Cellvibrio sp.]